MWREHKKRLPAFEKRQKQEIRATSGILQHLKRVFIPVFNGDKLHYEGWKAAFDICIGHQNISAEMKVLQLRQYVAGEALKCIGNLGYSTTAYEAPCNRLERRFRGTRCHLAIHLDSLDKFPPV